MYDTVVIATPPAAMRRWKSMSWGETTFFGLMPSKVAALRMRLDSCTGPSSHGAKGSTGGTLGS